MKCSKKEICERNLEATTNNMGEYGCVYICANCKRYYIKLGDSQIVEVEFANGERRFPKTKFLVRSTDNDGNDSIAEFTTEEEAERAIEDDLNCCKEFSKDSNYDYADFGNKTEFWISDGDEYVSWERLWK